MPDTNKNILIVLDLDHTLIYSSEYQKEHLQILLKYPPLIIYERPHARDLINICRQTGEIIVFTTAVKNYAESVCSRLEINYSKLLSREDCRVVNGMFEKYVEQNWLNKYDEILIIDDSPEIWDSNARNNCTFLIPEKFTGDANDNGLKEVIRELTEFKSKS